MAQPSQILKLPAGAQAELSKTGVRHGCQRQRKAEGGRGAEPGHPRKQAPHFGKAEEDDEEGTPRNCKGSELVSHSRNQLPIEISNRNMEVNFLLS